MSRKYWAGTGRAEAAKVMGEDGVRVMGLKDGRQGVGCSVASECGPWGRGRGWVHRQRLR